MNKMKQITVKTGNGIPILVNCYKEGKYLAVTKCQSGYCISHLPSGFILDRSFIFDKLNKAKIAFKNLSPDSSIWNWPNSDFIINMKYLRKIMRQALFEVENYDPKKSINY